jgi:L,D-peptidoglycan transpeptidase YkuD (ErfK/YbiS/YcfS/YnhG family)
MIPMRIRLLAALAAAALPATGAAAQSPAPPLQAVVATTDGWDATTARVRLFSRRTPASPWVQVGAAMSASVGRGGLGWGTGLHAAADQGSGPVKREGDGKAPAGIFRLSSAFGYAPADSARWVRLPYHASDPSIECVDDTASRFYNQRVDRDSVHRGLDEPRGDAPAGRTCTAGACGWITTRGRRRRAGARASSSTSARAPAPPPSAAPPSPKTTSAASSAGWIRAGAPYWCSSPRRSTGGCGGGGGCRER